jgi:hypothetical protein
MIEPKTDVWTRVDASLRSGLQEKIRLACDVLGDSLVSTTVYGEAVTGGFERKRHAVRSVLVLQSADLAVLRRLAPYGPRLGKAGMTAPWVVTRQYIHESLDTFPLEWLEIQQQGVTVVGPDHFAGLVLESENVRLQCERDIKQILMGLRRAVLAASGSQRAVADIESAALENLMRVLRGMLWLRGRREHLGSDVVIQEVEKVLGVLLAGVRAAMNPTAAHDWNEFDRLYGDVEILAGKADAM